MPLLLVVLKIELLSDSIKSLPSFAPMALENTELTSLLEGSPPAVSFDMISNSSFCGVVTVVMAYTDAVASVESSANRLRTEEERNAFEVASSVLLRVGKPTYCTGMAVVLATASWMDSFRARTASSDRLSRFTPSRVTVASNVTL